MAFEITSVEGLYEGWARFVIATIRLPDGQVLRREIEDHGNAVAVLPYDADRRTVMMVQQFRAPLLFAHRQDHTLEAIAGIEEDTDPQVTARREAMEEAGLVLGALEHIATVSTMPGISTERMTLYLAPYGAMDRVGRGGGLASEHENITVVEMPIVDLDALMNSGRLVDLKTLALAQALKLRYAALFR